MPGGKKPKRKGSNGEREFARLIGGCRIPLSGAAGGEWKGDVEWPGIGRGEIKRRRDGFRQLYGWLEGRDFLALRSDRQEWLVVMRLDDLLRILGREKADNDCGGKTTH